MYLLLKVMYALASAIWTWPPEFTLSIFSPLRPWYVSTCFLCEKGTTFQSTQLTRKFSQDILRLKLEIVNTMNFIVVLGLMRGYES